MIPTIILNKIYEYLFRLNNRELCKEYHMRIEYENDCHCILLDHNPFNWRITEDYYRYNNNRYIFLYRKIICNSNINNIKYGELTEKVSLNYF